MIPQFPTFKKLELSDKEEIEGHTKKYPLYSDFEFTSLYAWDTKQEMMLSRFNGNIVIRFTDYTTGDFFYTFIGDKEVDDTAQALLDLSQEKGYGSALRLIPEIAAQGLNTTRFTVQESRDNFDYIYELEPFVTFSGKKLKSRRNFLNGFLKRYPAHHVTLLNFQDSTHRALVEDLQDRWNQQTKSPLHHERMAYNRFIDTEGHYTYIAIGIMVDSILAGFILCALPEEGYVNALFAKTDTRYRGAYSALLHETAKILLSKGYTHINLEQDLGEKNLRQAKMAFQPVTFLKKYDVLTKNVNMPVPLG